MRRPEARAFALAFALAACEEAPGRPPPPPLPPCDQRVAAVRELFVRIPDAALAMPRIAGLHEPGGRPPESPLRLPESRAGEEVAGGVVVALRADGRWSVGGEEVDGGMLALFDAIDEAVDIARVDGRPSEVLLAFETGAPPARVVALAPLLRAFPERRLLVAVAGHAPPDEASLPEWARREIAEVRRMAATPGAPVFDRLVSCPALFTVEDRYGVLPPVERDRMWLTEVPRALESECRCRDADVEGVAALTWVRMEPWRTVVRGLPFAVTDDPGAEPLELAADATIVELVRAVEARGDRAFRLVSAGSGSAAAK